MISRPPSFDTSSGSSRSRRARPCGGSERSIQAATYPRPTTEVKLRAGLKPPIRQRRSLLRPVVSLSRPVARTSCMRRSALAVLVSVSMAGRLSGQPGTAAAHAAGTITAQDVARRIGIIADDSMLGRDTSSRGLELTAEYVAGQFRSFGLAPGGDDGGWYQRYPIKRRQFDSERSRVVLAAGGVEAEARFDRTA